MYANELSANFQKVSVPSGGSWSTSLADYIRHNDQALIESTDRLLQLYQEDLLTCQSFAEFCDVAGKLFFFFFCQCVYIFPILVRIFLFIRIITQEIDPLGGGSRCHLGTQMPLAYQISLVIGYRTSGGCYGSG